MTGIPRRTIASQRARGRVDPAVVVAIARAQPLPAYDSLAAVAGLPAMAARRPVRHVEVLSQTAADDVFAELLRRTRQSYADALTVVALSKTPVPDGVRQWINAIDPGNIRSNASERIGIDTSTLSAAITSGKVSLDVATLIAELSDTDPATGLVATGLITMQEAGWEPDARQRALSELDDIELLNLSSTRLTDLQRRTARHLNTQADDRRYWDVLG